MFWNASMALPSISTSISHSLWGPVFRGFTYIRRRMLIGIRPLPRVKQPATRSRSEFRLFSRHRFVTRVTLADIDLENLLRRPPKNIPFRIFVDEGQVPDNGRDIHIPVRII